MSKSYPNKSRITSVKVWLTTDQIAVLLNHALNNDRPVDLEKQVQFLIDCACSGDGAYAEAAWALQDEGFKPLPFDRTLLPDPQFEHLRRAEEKKRRKARKIGESESRSQSQSVDKGR